ncbi:hypothetical protein D3C87_1791310 [compost metagenome]
MRGPAGANDHHPKGLFNEEHLPDKWPFGRPIPQQGNGRYALTTGKQVSPISVVACRIGVRVEVGAGLAGVGIQVDEARADALGDSV